MRICLPIIAIIVTICCRFASSGPADGPRQMQPPMERELLTSVYAAAAARPTTIPAADNIPSHQTCNFRLTRIWPLSDRP